MNKIWLKFLEQFHDIGAWFVFACQVFKWNCPMEDADTKK